MKLVTIIGVSLLAIAAVAAAGVRSDKAVPPPAAADASKTEVVPLTHDVRPASKRPVASNKGPSLRCWQYGRLIFEEPVSDVPASLGGSGHKFEGRAGTVQLVDMHNASCLIK